MPTSSLYRGASPRTTSGAAKCPIYVDSDDNKVKVVPAGSGTTEVELIPTGRSETYLINSRAKVGGTAGWVVGAATNLPYLGTMAASQTGGTLVVPVDNLKVGDIITAFNIQAQVESAGGTVTIDADLRAVTNVAAEPTDASIGAITQVSVTADTASAASKSGLTETVTAGKTYYILVTATTGASCDIILQSLGVTITKS